MEFIVHTVATVFLSLAYLAAGLILAHIGKGLLEKGIRGDFAGEGEIATRKFKIITSSPGILFLIAGLGIVIAAIISPSEFIQQYSVGRTKQVETDNLKRLADNYIQSKMATSSWQGEVERFSHWHFDRAVILADQKEVEAAEAHLIMAVILDPQLAQKALDTEKLEEIVALKDFVDVASVWLKLAPKLTEHPPLAPKPSAAVLNRLRLYLAARISIKGSVRDEEQVVDTHPLRTPPVPGDQMGRTKIKHTLDRLLVHDPFKLLEVLQDSTYRWILEDQIYVDFLERRLRSLNDELASSK